MQRKLGLLWSPHQRKPLPYPYNCKYSWCILLGKVCFALVSTKIGWNYWPLLDHAEFDNSADNVLTTVLTMCWQQCWQCCQQCVDNSADYVRSHRSVKSLMLKLIDNLVTLSDPSKPHRMEIKKQVREAVNIFELLRWTYYDCHQEQTVGICCWNESCVGLKYFFSSLQELYTCWTSHYCLLFYHRRE